MNKMKNKDKKCNKKWIKNNNKQKKRKRKIMGKDKKATWVK